MMLPPWAVIARREYVIRVRSNAFWIGTILGPLILIAAAYLPSWVATPGRSLPIVGVVDRGRVWEDTASEAGTGVPGVVWWPVPPDLGDEAATSLVADRVVDALLIVSGDASGGELVTASSLPADELSRLHATLESALYAAAIRMRGLIRGIDDTTLAALAEPPRLRIRTVPGPDPARAAGLAVVVATLLYATLLTHGLATMRAIVEEKAHRVVELVLSSARPVDVLAGKIAGIAAVGVTQYGVWLVLAAALLGAHGPLPRRAASEALPPLGAGLTAACVGYFLLGYALFAALYAMVGGMVSLPADAQHLHLPVTALLVAPIFLVWPVVASQGSWAGRVISLVPVCAPVLMPARLVVGSASVGEVVASMVILACAAAVSLGGAARVYRAGILRRGAPPTLKEVGQWVRRR